MKKPLLYRLFGVGRIPAQFGAALQSEGAIVSDEGVKGSTTYINFRAPGKYSNWRRIWFSGAIVMTNVRLLGFQYANTIIDVPFADERFRQIKFSLEDENTLLVAFDASLFHGDWSGNIEYRFRTEYARDFFNHLTEKQTLP